MLLENVPLRLIKKEISKSERRVRNLVYSLNKPNGYQGKKDREDMNQYLLKQIRNENHFLNMCLCNIDFIMEREKNV
tara:strand:- start:724 stop:954 length:231 start_codon:yes stop_codon:yes gene_type:complete